MIAYRYLGKIDGRHSLVSVSTAIRYECGEPCRIIMFQDRGSKQRIAYSADSIIGSAFEDAISGLLEPVKAREAKVEPPSPSAIPERFHGEWNADLSACGTGLSDSRVRIEASRVLFYESVAEVKSVAAEGPANLKVTGTFSGEGRTWRETFSMRLSRSGDTLIIDGSSRRRCV